MSLDFWAAFTLRDWCAFAATIFLVVGLSNLSFGDKKEGSNLLKTDAARNRGDSPPA
jgi:hypothetical protein